MEVSSSPKVEEDLTSGSAGLVLFFAVRCFAFVGLWVDSAFCGEAAKAFSEGVRSSAGRNNMIRRSISSPRVVIGPPFPKIFNPSDEKKSRGITARLGTFSLLVLSLRSHPRWLAKSLRACWSLAGLVSCECTKNPHLPEDWSTFPSTVRQFLPIVSLNTSTWSGARKSVLLQSRAPLGRGRWQRLGYLSKAEPPHSRE